MTRLPLADFPAAVKAQATLPLADGRPIETRTERRKRLRAGYAKKFRESAPGAISVRKSQRELRNRRRAYVHELKSVPCMDCGGTFDPICMDFDHRPGTVKEFCIGTRLQLSLERILAEIAKCDIVCANCHRIRTHRKRDHRDTVARGRKAKP